MPQIPDDFDDYLRKRNDGKLPTDGLYTHCARELFQKQWSVMLDDELLDAMKYGLVILCPDGRRRCFYPRIFTYSADYPEKQVSAPVPFHKRLLILIVLSHCRTLVAGLRNNGGCPCHRCLVAKGDLSKLGAPTDTERRDQKRSEEEQRRLVDLARDEIEDGFAVDGKRIDAHLKSQSLVPVHVSLSKLYKLW